MQNIRQLQTEKQTIESLKLIAEALADVATSRIKNTRGYMEKNVEYFREIYKVYRMIKIASNKEEAARVGLAKIRNTFEDIKRQKNGRTICILLSSSERFNGGLDMGVSLYYLARIEESLSLNSSKPISLFLSQEEGSTAPKYNTQKGLGLDKGKTDYLVIGSSGPGYLRLNNFDHRFKEVKFKKDFPSFEELKSLSDIVFKYSRILVFHPQFITILNQTPTISEINSSDLDPKFEKSVAIPDFIIEPDAERMLDFFEGQILILLFHAVFLEVDLARTAARMISMNKASDNASKILSDETKQILRVKKQILNLKILETYAGMIKREEN